MADKPLVMKTMRVIAEMYNRDISEALYLMYAELLADVPTEAFTAAAKALAESSRFFPTIADIRGKVAEFAMQNAGYPSPAEAWTQVSRSRTAIGDAHPLAQSAFENLGGWPAFGPSDIDAAVSWRARFSTEYERLIDLERQRATLSPGTQEAAAMITAGRERAQDEIRMLVDKVRLS